MIENETEIVQMKLRTKLLIAVGMGILLSFGFYGLDQYNRYRFASGVPFRLITHEIPIQTQWVWVYFAYFPLCFLPLVFARVRNDGDVFRRVAIGFLMQFSVAFLTFFLLPIRMIQPRFETVSLSGQVLAWLHGVDHGFNVFPSLHVANVFFLAAVVWHIKGKIWGAALTLVTLTVSVSTVLVGQHCISDAVVGMSLGVLSFKMAFSEPMRHLMSNHARRYIICHLKNLWNLWVKNNPGFWDEQYRSGHWESLKSVDQRPRYYTIQGLIGENFPDKCQMLDVGCGEGILHDFVKDRADFYEGVDCAGAAIQSCLTRLTQNGNTAFHVATFDQFNPGRKYDVIVFNEILYYMSARDAMKTMDTARSFLKDEKSMIVVSMNSNPRSPWIYRKIESAYKACQSIRVQNTHTGSFWTIKTFAGLG